MDTTNVTISTKKVPEYKDFEIPSALYALHPDYNLNEQTKNFIFSKLVKNNVPINKYSVDNAYKLYHRIVAEEPTKEKLKKFTKAIKRYDTGFKKFLKEVEEPVIESLNEEFNEKFGRAPQILDTLAKIKEVGAKHDVPEIHNLVSKFNVDFVRTLREQKIPVAYIALFYSVLEPADCSAIVNILNTPLNGYANGSEDRVSEVCYLGELLLKYFFEKTENKSRYLNTAKWFARHLDTNLETLKFVFKRVEELDLNENDTLDKVKAEIAKSESLPEVERVEKKYGNYGFKFSDCVCELKQVGEKVYSGKYVAYIMEASDPRQVSLGQATNCCQKLGDAGESAMMHGLLNPYAGFLIVEEKATAMIKAQAEVWELDRDTLVLDNIEMRNDADIHHYSDVLIEWLKKSEYSNIYTGTGYNDINSAATFCFDEKEGFIPPVTAEEIYIISHEGDREALDSIEEAEDLINDNEEKTSDDYVYSDAEDRVYIFKENGKLSKALVTDKEVFDYAKNLSNAGAGKLSSFYRTMYELNFGKIEKPIETRCSESEIANAFEKIATETNGFTKTISPSDIYTKAEMSNIERCITNYGYNTEGIRFHYGCYAGNDAVTVNHYVMNNLPIVKTKDDKKPVKIEVVEDPSNKKKTIKIKKEAEILSPVLKNSIITTLSSDKNTKIEEEINPDDFSYWGRFHDDTSVPEDDYEEDDDLSLDDL